jgi:ABC-2 type transport system ATP-binding protein
MAHLRVLAASNGIGASRIGEVLARTGLTEVARRRVGGFSLGMKQRLGLAAALLGDPPILMLDEPVNGLDPEGMYWIRRLLKELAAEGRTVFVSSHLLAEMALIADDLVIIGRGRLVAASSTADFIAANTGSDTASDTGAGAPQASLEEAYLKATGGFVDFRDSEPTGTGTSASTGRTHL